MEREKIKLTNSQWRDMVQENYLKIDGVDIDITIVQEEYESSGRHTEHHYIVFQRESDKKFFRIDYETSVKDSMGWDECNYGDTEAYEVFPEEKLIILYN